MSMTAAILILCGAIEASVGAQAGASTGASADAPAVASTGASAGGWAGESVGESPRGAVVAPIERGGLAYYSTFGYPELRSGFREGMHGYEIGGEIGFDYALTSLWLAATGRLPLRETVRDSLFIEGQLGVFGSFGERYIEDRNRPGQGLRLQFGGGYARRFDLPILFNAGARIPFDLPLSSTGLLRFGLLVGAGIELSLTRDFFASLGAAVGPMLWHQRGGQSSFKFAYEVSVGLGYRLF